MKDWIEILAEPLSVDAAVRFVSDPTAGGIDVFLGTTRADESEDRRALVALDYEAYVEMAEGQLRDLVRRARERWPICRVVLLHRIGLLELGECSVIVVAGTSTGMVQRYLNWTDRSRGAVILRRICGVLVLVGGLYLIYLAPATAGEP